jgi:hypothetical protein
MPGVVLRVVVSVEKGWGLSRPCLASSSSEKAMHADEMWDGPSWDTSLRAYR